MANSKYFTSPKGSAGYPKLIKPDTKFNSAGVYKTSLTISKEAAEPFIEQIKCAFEEEFGAKKLSQLVPPYKQDESGDYVFNFKTKTKPKLFDAAGKPVVGKAAEKLNIGSGSVLKIKGSVGPNQTQGKYYATLWINEVQIIELVEFGGSNGFGAEEGGFSADNLGDDDEADTQVDTSGDTEDF